jgi:hypothetical protein
MPIRLLNPLLGLLLAVAAGACPAAETYKWVDEKGVVNYGEKPPASSPARPVDTSPSAVLEGGSQYSQKPAGDRRDAPPIAAVLAPGAESVRGMDFDIYIRLQRGMSEGELLLRAGRPDHEGLENFRHDIVKSYYYFPTVANPYTTIVTLRGGRISYLERIKKF